MSYICYEYDNRFSGKEETEAFAPPPARKEYIEFEKGANRENPEDIRKLKQKLMQRCYRSIPLLHELQNGAPSADRLYKKGMITDAMYERFKHMKAFFDVEFPEVQREAKLLVPGWEQSIWQQANQYYLVQNKAEANKSRGVGADGEVTKGKSKEQQEEDDDDNIMVTSPAKKSESIDSASTGNNTNSSKTVEKNRDTKKLKGMSDEQKAEHFAAELVREEAAQNKGGKKTGKKTGKKYQL